MSLLGILLLAYALVGSAYWLWMAVGCWLIAQRVPSLNQEDAPAPPAWPPFSIIIPACNEAETLEPAVRQLLEEDYPGLEIVLIDDRSTDGTGAIVDRLAASDPRIQPVHVADLPAGWLGKVHALHQGAARAAGEWLLMMDADVHLRPGTLRRAVAYAEHHKLDHVAGAPDIWSRNLLLRVAIASFLRTFCVTLRVWAVPDPRSKAFVGVGAFNLVRRAALDRTEGFPWLRLEVADDVGLGLMLKQSGARSTLLNAHGHVRVEWYRSLTDMAHGTEKAFASVAHCSVARVLAVCAVATALDAAPLVALAGWGVPGLMPLGGLMLASAALSVVVLHRWGGGAIWAGLLFPLALPLNVFFLLRCGWLGWRRGGIVWRGTLYPSSLLKNNLRVRIP